LHQPCCYLAHSICARYPFVPSRLDAQRNGRSGGYSLNISTPLLLSSWDLFIFFHFCYLIFYAETEAMENSQHQTPQERQNVEPEGAWMLPAKSPCRLIRLLIAACTFFIVQQADVQAQIVDWTNTTGTPNPWYDDGSNWAGGVAPDPNETARFDLPDNYEVWWDSTTVSTTPEVGFLDIAAGDVTFRNNGRDEQYELTILGSGVNGSFSDFSISGSTTTLTNRGLHLHSLGGAQLLDGGTLTLDGSHAQGARLTVDEYTAIQRYAGFQVDGNLNVEGGGVVSNSRGYVGYDSGSTGYALVSGAGSQWNNSNYLYIGYKGTGTLNVEAGGVVNNKTGYIGRGSNSTGVATVFGGGSEWITSDSLYVGYSGTGTLNVEAGGVVSSIDVFIGSRTGSTGAVTVSGVGSQWNNTNWLDIGSYGTGMLNIEDGGVVNSTWDSIGTEYDSTGVATVTGIGSQWNLSDRLDVGYSGTGTLNVDRGGVVSCTSGYIAYRGSTGTATISGKGSQWNNSIGLYLGGSASRDGGKGTLNLEGLGQVNVGNDPYIRKDHDRDDAVVTVSDTVASANLWVRNGSVINSGHGLIGFSPGSTGTATVSGVGSQWNNTIYLEIGHFGSGTLNIEDGGVVNSVWDALGTYGKSTGVATVTGVGSQWNLSERLDVGYEATGTLNVYAGGVVSSMSGYIGAEPGSTGVATVTGFGSQWKNSSRLYVGYEATGTLNVDHGGAVSSTSVYIGVYKGSTGTLNI
jgi:T5SS/PEP-CTERM-associated repeat protein